MRWESARWIGKNSLLCRFIADHILSAEHVEGSTAHEAGATVAAVALMTVVAGPGEMDGGVNIQREAHNLMLDHAGKWAEDTRAAGGTDVEHVIERFVEFDGVVGIGPTFFEVEAQHEGVVAIAVTETGGQCTEDEVARRNPLVGKFGACLVLSNGQLLIGERGAAQAAKPVEVFKAIIALKRTSNRLYGCHLPFLRPAAIAEMQEGDLVALHLRPLCRRRAIETAAANDERPPPVFASLKRLFAHLHCISVDLQQ